MDRLPPNTMDDNKYVLLSPMLIPSEIIDQASLQKSRSGLSNALPSSPLRANPSTGRSQCKRKRTSLIKSLRFAHEAFLYPTLRTEEEVVDSWYSAGELAEFKQERKETIRQFKSVGFDMQKIGDRYCMRGFEAYFSVEMHKATKYARDLVMSVVLVEQNRQRSKGRSDDETIRLQCAGASQWARDNAQELGTLDAKDCVLLSKENQEFIGMPHIDASCVLVTSSIQRKPARIEQVDQAKVQQLAIELRAIKAMAEKT